MKLEKKLLLIKIFTRSTCWGKTVPQSKLQRKYSQIIIQIVDHKDATNTIFYNKKSITERKKKMKMIKIIKKKKTTS